MSPTQDPVKKIEVSKVESAQSMPTPNKVTNLTSRRGRWVDRALGEIFRKQNRAN